MRRHLLALSVLVLVPPAGEARADSPLQFRLSPHVGWVGLFESTTTDTVGGGTDTNIGMLAYGGDASFGLAGLPLVLKLEGLFGQTSVDSTDVSPTRTDVGFSRLA